MEEIFEKFGSMENILATIRKYAAKVGRESTRMMLELFYVLKNPDTSVASKSLIVAALGYQLLPKDLLPRKKYGAVGLLDNGITIAVAYNRLKASVTPEIEMQVQNLLDSWFGENTRNFDDYEVVE